jgi:hypothetical protein
MKEWLYYKVTGLKNTVVHGILLLLFLYAQWYYSVWKSVSHSNKEIKKYQKKIPMWFLEKQEQSKTT